MRDENLNGNSPLTAIACSRCPWTIQKHFRLPTKSCPRVMGGDVLLPDLRGAGEQSAPCVSPIRPTKAHSRRRFQMSSSRDQKQCKFAQQLVTSRVGTRMPAIVSMLLALVLSVSLGSWAQTLSGTLRVEVSDPTGALVPDARVTVTNEATRVSST